MTINGYLNHSEKERENTDLNLVFGSVPFKVTVPSPSLIAINSNVITVVPFVSSVPAPTNLPDLNLVFGSDTDELYVGDTFKVSLVVNSTDLEDYSKWIFLIFIFSFSLMTSKI